MRRPDIELTDSAARFVEQHPDLISRLAGQDTAVRPEVTERQRARFARYVGDKLAFARSDEGVAAGAAFLSRFAGR